MTKNKRYTFMNILRIMALAVVVVYHFLADVYQRGLCEIRHPDAHVVVGNINLVMVAVGIFFILSGCGLVLMMRRNESRAAFLSGTEGAHGKWKAYYTSRFFKILVPFYITYIAYLVYKLISAESALFEGVEWWRAIFTVLGIDEYLNMTGVATFSLGIGEWFLGALIMMYAVFPLLYTAMKKWKWQTIAIATVYYIIIILTYNSDIAWYNNVFVKIYDFVVGMFLAFEFEDLASIGRPGGREKSGSGEISSKGRYSSAILLTLVVVTAAFTVIQINPAFSNILVCVGIFLIGFFIEDIVSGICCAEDTASIGKASAAPSAEIGKTSSAPSAAAGRASSSGGTSAIGRASSSGDTSVISRFFAKLCSYEYYVFLVHHCVIYLYHEPMQKARMIISKPKLIVLFIIELVTMALLAIAIKWIADRFKPAGATRLKSQEETAAKLDKSG